MEVPLPNEWFDFPSFYIIRMTGKLHLDKFQCSGVPLVRQHSSGWHQCPEDVRHSLFSSAFLIQMPSRQSATKSRTACRVDSIPDSATATCSSAGHPKAQPNSFRHIALPPVIAVEQSEWLRGLEVIGRHLARRAGAAKGGFKVSANRDRRLTRGRKTCPDDGQRQGSPVCVRARQDGSPRQDRVSGHASRSSNPRQ